MNGDRVLYPTFGEPEIDRSPFRDEPRFDGQDEPFETDIGCEDVTHPVQHVRVTHPSQEFFCTICNRRLSRHIYNEERP